MFRNFGVAISVMAVAAAMAACSRQSAGDAAVAAASTPPPSEASFSSGPRDEKILAEETPYQARHGKVACRMPDCVGHEAGYKWAALHSLRDASACSSENPNFVEGCIAYVTDRRRS